MIKNGTVLTMTTEIELLTAVENPVSGGEQVRREAGGERPRHDRRGCDDDTEEAAPHPAEAERPDGGGHEGG
jgi:hypothetical protein